MKKSERFGTDSKKIFDKLCNDYGSLVRDNVKYSPQRHSGYVHCFLKDGASLWFVIYSNIAKKAQDKNQKWINTFTKDNTIIKEEYIKKESEKDYQLDLSSDKRLVFARDKNVGKNEYVFMGIYQKRTPKDELNHKYLEYELISDSDDIIFTLEQ